MLLLLLESIAGKLVHKDREEEESTRLEKSIEENENTRLENSINEERECVINSFSTNVDGDDRGGTT